MDTKYLLPSANNEKCWAISLWQMQEQLWKVTIKPEITSTCKHLPVSMFGDILPYPEERKYL